MVNPVVCRVLMTCYYMPSFHMSWIEVLLHSPNEFIKLTDAFYLIQQKTENHLQQIYAHHTFYTYVNAYVYVTIKNVCFQGKKDETVIKTNSSCAPVSQNTFVAVILKFCTQNNF